MPLYNLETPNHHTLTVMQVIDGQEYRHDGCVALHTEQDWADVVDFEAPITPSMTQFPIKRIRGLFFVLDRNGRRNPLPDSL